MKIFAFHIKRFCCRLKFKWYDLWVGLYYDEEHGIWYFCPVPTLAFEFQLIQKRKS
jgi:hypothetical protein